jgi:hypothetical protein
VPALFALPLRTRCDSDVLELDMIAMTAKGQYLPRRCGPVFLVHLSNLEVDQQRVCFVRVAVVGDDRQWTIGSTPSLEGGAVVSRRSRSSDHGNRVLVRMGAS